MVLERAAERATAVGAAVPVAEPAPPARKPPAAYTPAGAPGGIEEARGEQLVLRFEARRCIHARHCVLGAPRVFLANVQGPWLYPDEMDAEGLVHIASKNDMKSTMASGSQKGLSTPLCSSPHAISPIETYPTKRST